MGGALNRHGDHAGLLSAGLVEKRLRWDTVGQNRVAQIEVLIDSVLRSLERAALDTFNAVQRVHRAVRWNMKRCVGA